MPSRVYLLYVFTLQMKLGASHVLLHIQYVNCNAPVCHVCTLASKVLVCARVFSLGDYIPPPSGEGSTECFEFHTI